MRALVTLASLFVVAFLVLCYTLTGWMTNTATVDMPLCIRLESETRTGDMRATNILSSVITVGDSLLLGYEYLFMNGTDAALKYWSPWAKGWFSYSCGKHRNDPLKLPRYYLADSERDIVRGVKALSLL